MAKKPFPFKVCEQCCNTGGGTGGGGITESEVVEIIRANAQQYINEDTTLPPSVACMLAYIDSYCSVYGGDIEALRNEMYADYVSKAELNDSVAHTDNFINHDMRIENLELANGDLETALDNIIAIQNSLIGGGSV